MNPPNDLALRTRLLTERAGTSLARASLGITQPVRQAEVTQRQQTLDGGRQDYADRQHLIAAGYLEVIGSQVDLLPGTYSTYRMMDSQPTLALARAVCFAPILSSGWTWKKRNGVPEERVEFIKNMFDPMRPLILMHALRALSMGWKPFEQIWAMKQVGQSVKRWMMTIKKLKPLSEEMSYIYTHNLTGGFQGVAQGSVYLDHWKTWVYTHDEPGGGFYGRPRHENCRQEYSESRFLRRQAARLVKKVSAIIPIVRFIKGNSRDPVTGETVDNFGVAMRLLAALSQANGVAFESLAFDQDDIRNNPELIHQAAMSMEILDTKGAAEAIAPMTSREEYYDKLFIRAWNRSERAALEALTGGSRADSEAATNISIADSEWVHADILRQLNWHSVDDVLAINFGEEERGSVWAEPNPILNHNRETLNTILTGITTNPGLFEQALETIDTDSMYDKLGVPVKEVEPGQMPRQLPPSPRATPGALPAPTPTPASDAAARRVFAQAAQ